MSNNQRRGGDALAMDEEKFSALQDDVNYWSLKVSLLPHTNILFYLTNRVVDMIEFGPLLGPGDTQG